MEHKNRFEEKFRVTPSCWVWQGSRHNKGYGHFRLNGKVAKAHIVAYEMYVGEIPSGLLVRHRCDNPSCVNPDHLELGTHADNMKDRNDRGRKAFGERSGKTTLSDADVERMYELRKQGVSREEVAQMFNVSGRTVWYALKTRLGVY